MWHDPIERLNQWITVCFWEVLPCLVAYWFKNKTEEDFKQIIWILACMISQFIYLGPIKKKKIYILRLFSSSPYDNKLSLNTINSQLYI